MMKSYDQQKILEKSNRCLKNAGPRKSVRSAFYRIVIDSKKESARNDMDSNQTFESL
jgi:hypothetical protein